MRCGCAQDGGGGFAFGFGGGVVGGGGVVEGLEGGGCAVGGLGGGALVGGAAEARQEGADGLGLEPVEQLGEGDVEEGGQLGEGVGGGEVGAQELALVQMGWEGAREGVARLGVVGLVGGCVPGHVRQGACPMRGVKRLGVEGAEGARGGGG